MANRDSAALTAISTLLNCWRREVDPGHPDRGSVRLPLQHLGLTLIAPVAYDSPTGYHAYGGPPRLDPSGATLDVPTLASLLGRELALGAPGGGRDADVAGFVAAVLDSAANIARFTAGPHGEPAAVPFVRAEQSLVRGHPLHPTAKGRADMTDAERDATAPELRAAFPLHWFRVRPERVAQDAVGEPASHRLARVLAGDLGGVGRVPGGVLVPVHPVQARRLHEQPAVRALLDRGEVEYLGPLGAPWRPTSSVRTVARDDVDFQLKLSLDVRVTNSVRRNLRKELARGVEVARLLDAGLGAAIAEHHPGFGIVRDPAWLTVDSGEGQESGFAVVLRDQPFPADVDATVVAGLGEVPPEGGPPRLATLVSGDTARAWFRRYLAVVADPLIWLAAHWGIALEAHQQNGVLVLEDGWPAGFRYRDNQGYYFKASAEPRLRALVPGLNRDSDTLCADAVADERFGYYLGVNHLLGLVGTFGALGLADERDLLADLGDHLDALQAGGTPVPPIGSDAVLRVKGNLRTRLWDMDELVGPMAEQSVYVDWPNPVAAARTGVPA